MESLDLELPTASENMLHYELYTDRDGRQPSGNKARSVLRHACVVSADTLELLKGLF